ERGAIDEGDPDGAIGSGLDRVVPVDRITNVDSSDNPARAHDGDQAGRRLDRADCLERRSPRYMGVAATSAIITWRIPDATEHATPPCAVGPRDESLLPFLHDLFGGEFIPVYSRRRKLLTILFRYR